MNEDLLGQYAIFVVPAYLLTIGGFAGLAILTRQKLKYWKWRAREEEDLRKKKTAP